MTGADSARCRCDRASQQRHHHNLRCNLQRRRNPLSGHLSKLILSHRDCTRVSASQVSRSRTNCFRHATLGRDTQVEERRLGLFWKRHRIFSRGRKKDRQGHCCWEDQNRVSPFHEHESSLGDVLLKHLLLDLRLAVTSFNPPSKHSPINQNLLLEASSQSCDCLQK